MFGLGHRLAQPTGLLARVGSVLAYIAVVAGVLNTLALAAFVIPLHFAGAMIGVFSLGIGTVLIGTAALGNSEWRRWRALPLVVGVLGILVFPLSMLTFGGPAESVGVALMALFGLGWVAIGYSVWSNGRGSGEYRRGELS